MLGLDRVCGRASVTGLTPSCCLDKGWRGRPGWDYKGLSSLDSPANLSQWRPELKAPRHLPTLSYEGTPSPQLDSDTLHSATIAPETMEWLASNVVTRMT